MSARPWYRRFPSNFITGTASLTLEEKGAYNVVLDLIYDHGGPIEDEPRFIAGICNCSVRKWNAIRDRLISLGKLQVVDGMLTNDRAEKEIEISLETSRERAESGSKGGVKSAENRVDQSKNKDLGQAKLKHTRASPLPSPFKKEGATLLDPTEGTVALDRWSDEALFQACEKLTKKVPDFLQRHSFPAAIVDQARKQLAH